MQVVWVALSHPPAWVDVLGYALVALVGVQLLVGYRRFPRHWARFRPLHIGLAWSIAALMGAHGLIGVGHALAGYFLRR